MILSGCIGNYPDKEFAERAIIEKKEEQKMDQMNNLKIEIMNKVFILSLLIIY